MNENSEKRAKNTHQTERTDFWSERGRSTYFTSSSSEVDDFDFIGVLESTRIQISRREMVNVQH